MSLDATAREANLRDSVKKFFVDNLVTAEGVQVTFDRGLSTPKVQGSEVDRWVAIKIGEITLETLSSAIVTIFCCTKMDSEGFKLAQLRDKVVGYLLNDSFPDGSGRITLYRSHASDAWVNVGGIVICLESESPTMEAEDNSKIKAITITLKWSAKV
jgi:hypothetical protein